MLLWAYEIWATRHYLHADTDGIIIMQYAIMLKPFYDLLSRAILLRHMIQIPTTYLCAHVKTVLVLALAGIALM